MKSYKYICQTINKQYMKRAELKVEADFKTTFPDVSEKQLIAYNKMNPEEKATGGISIAVDSIPVYSILQLENGNTKHVHIVKGLIDELTTVRASEQFLRTSQTHFQKLAHAGKRMLTGYGEFHGKLTDEQMGWVEKNTASFEEELFTAKQRAQQNQIQNTLKNAENE